MQIVLYDNDAFRQRLYPLSLTRPVSNLRVGILTIDEKWSKYFNSPVSFLSTDHLIHKFPLSDFSGSALIIRGDIIPDLQLLEALNNLKSGEGLVSSNELIAFKTQVSDSKELSSFHFNELKGSDHSAIN